MEHTQEMKSTQQIKAGYPEVNWPQNRFYILVGQERITANLECRFFAKGKGQGEGGKQSDRCTKRDRGSVVQAFCVVSASVPATHPEGGGYCPHVLHTRRLPPAAFPTLSNLLK